MMIVFIVFQHARYAVFRQFHDNIEFRGDVPRAVVLMLRFAANFQFQIFDVIDTRQNDRMECRNHFAFQEHITQNAQKFQK